MLFMWCIVFSEVLVLGEALENNGASDEVVRGIGYA